ncbi:hypothetical protein [Acinetobacter sp. WCHAc010034]|nr:hypothetical protein [Acinetobacter sp. WCHAc010034]
MKREATEVLATMSLTVSNKIKGCVKIYSG